MSERMTGSVAGRAAGWVWVDACMRSWMGWDRIELMDALGLYKVTYTISHTVYSQPSTSLACFI